MNECPCCTHDTKGPICEVCGIGLPEDWAEASAEMHGARIAIQRRGRDRTYLKVTIREGKNREIRRVFARLGYTVLLLKRVRIGNLSLHGLGAGRFRFLKPMEVEDVLALSGAKGRSRGRNS